MKLTREQSAAINAPGHVYLQACPGSGKTTTLIHKVAKTAEAISNTNRKIACITYTNSAVYEIEERLQKGFSKEASAICQISTIHTFCLNEILRNYYWRTEKYKNGFSVLAPENDHYKAVVQEIMTTHNLSRDAAEKFESLNFKIDGTPIAPPEIGTTAAKAFWDLIGDANYIDFPNILYQSFRLVRQYPGLAKGLASKYAYFAVDESQDTTEIQIELLREISRFGQSTFFIVGDPHQSVFGFAGARPDLMTKFALELGATPLHLTENFRSSEILTAHAEKLISRTPPMRSRGKWTDYPQAVLYLEVDKFDKGIEDHFLPALESLQIEIKDCAILAPTWFTLPPIARKFGSLGIPVTGPGARPYRRNHIFSRIAEQICAFINDSTPPRLFRIQRELFNAVLELEGKHNYALLEFPGAVLAKKLVNIGAEIISYKPLALDWLDEAAKNFSAILYDDGWLSLQGTTNLRNSAHEIGKEINDHLKFNTAALQASSLGLFASPENSAKLMTMHKAKGHEFDAVALIDTSDARIPHPRNRTQSGIEEARRLMYVAMTRPKKLLMCFNQKSTEWSRFYGALM